MYYRHMNTWFHSLNISLIRTAADVCWPWQWMVSRVGWGVLITRTRHEGGEVSERLRTTDIKLQASLRSIKFSVHDSTINKHPMVCKESFNSNSLITKKKFVQHFFWANILWTDEKKEKHCGRWVSPVTSFHRTSLSLENVVSVCC